MIKDIIVNLTPGEGRDPVTDYAVSLASALGAHAVGVAFIYDPIIPATVMGGGIPADLRLVESANFRVQESILTGESEPVEKQTGAYELTTMPLGDRRNMAYMGTSISSGRGEGVVTETGMRTELGRIAGMIQGTDESRSA